MLQPQTTEFFDGPAVPEMREAMLDANNVRELVADLQHFTAILSVQCKSSLRSHNLPLIELSLDEAIESMLRQQLPAIQVRYHYQLYEWTDTLIQTASGVRLVRCRHEPTSGR